MRTLAFVAFLFAFWVLLSGHFTPLLLGFGLVSCVMVVWLSHRMDITDHEGYPVHVTPKLPQYWLWLAIATLKSNFFAARLILRRNPGRAAAVRELSTAGLNGLGQTIAANSITLTPGTLSMNTDDGTITVHGLNEQAIADLESGSLLKRVRQLRA